MAENQTIDIENVFKTVSLGSLDELEKICFWLWPRRKEENLKLFQPQGGNTSDVCHQRRQL